MLNKLFNKIKFLSQKREPDAKIWIQRIILKKNLNSFKYWSFYIYFNVYERGHIAPVAQLDRALGYGPGGSGFKS